MKKLEFETSKGRFVVFNAVTDDFDGFKYKTNYYFKGRIIKLSEITEEQANNIIDEPFSLEVGDDEVIVFKDYEDEENTYSNSIDSLYSLIFSKGIHLFENPYKNHQDKDLETWYEELTFYNPFIFKI